MSTRLPRMRGDRPGWKTGKKRDAPAAPHARGSTPRESAGVVAIRGCPACAGIDPHDRRRVRWRRRLPRMRGDRPPSDPERERRHAAAPHARGSTPKRSRTRAPPRGCPACAGIDPRRAPLAVVRSRLPRMRGDRPASELKPSHAFSAAPHARGSTRPAQVPVVELLGCPACAGIDPPPTKSSRWSLRLPRMRGDRPR